MSSKKKNRNRNFHKSPPRLWEQLEERCLFDAAGFVDPAELIGEIGAETSQSRDFEADTTAHAPQQQEEKSFAANLIFVDMAVEDLDSLLSRINITSNTEIIFLSPVADGLSQITNELQSRRDIEAVHILSHGGSGELKLGNAIVHTEDLQNQYASSLQGIVSSLTPDADILFYGCRLGEGDAGRLFIDTLAKLTEADVAASNDLTGNAGQGGDWDLEVQHGTIQAKQLSAHNWSGLLAVEASDSIVTVQDAENSGAGSVSLSNDAAPLAVTTSNTPFRVGQMLERVWQFSETADAGKATFVMDINGIGGINGTIASDFGIIISDQSDLSGADTTTLVASGYDVTNGLLYFHGVDLEDGDYFGLATEVIADNFRTYATASGLEDTPIDLGLTLNPALVDGGTLRDIIDTEIGFRASSAGSNTTDFFIPAGTTGIKITGYSTRDIGTPTNDARNDDYQTLNVSIDLTAQTSNGFIAHLIDQGPSRSDQFGWSDAPLGSAVLSGGGSVTGDADDNFNPTFSIANGVLQIAENHQLQTAYHVEFLTNATSSAEFIQTASAVREDRDQTNVTLTPPANADFLVLSIADAATSSDSQVEYKGNSRIYIDLNTLTASGTVAAQRGETDARVISYAFKGYDVSSASVGSVLSSGATVVGDTAQTQGLLNDSQIYIDGSGNLVIDRENTFANNFNSLVTVEYYERKDIGSSAEKLGEATDYGRWEADPSDPISTLEFDIPANATLGILNLSMNGTRTSNTNENMGAGFAVIDLVSGTSSGTMYMVRTGNIVDFVAWEGTDFGTVFFEDPNSTSNHTSINQFNDKFAGNAGFNLTNGGATLELSTHSPAGTQSFLDYFAAGQVEWYGSAPFQLTGFPVGGSFSSGSLNTGTGDWDLTIQEALGGLYFIPDAHVSGLTPIDVSIRIGDETDTTQVRIEAVIDPISFNAVDACGDEDTDIAIDASVTPTFIDQDGSETVTAMTLSNIVIGHTISDGVNTFVSSTGNQSVDITGWNRDALTYRAGAEESGTFTVDLAVDWQDVGGGVTDTDSLNTSFDVEVKPVNDAPTAVDDFHAVLGNTTLNIAASNGVLVNDSDIEGDVLTVNTSPVDAPSSGAVTLNSDGSFSYTPATGFFGTDSFDYEVSDGNGGTTIATVYIDVSEPVTGPLSAYDDARATPEETLININVMGNDSLPLTGAFNVQSTTPPSNGSIVVKTDGTIDYTPETDFFGVDTFTYTIADASGRTSTATVQVTVSNTQDPPEANADSGSTPEDTTLFAINVLANDSDVDGDTLMVSTASAANGSVTINGDGTIDYTPNLNFTGTDTITYTVSDGNGGTAQSTVLINVVPVADPPTSADHTVCADEDSEYVFAFADFAFADGDPGDILTTIRIDSVPADGDLLLLGNPVSSGDIVSATDIATGRLAFKPDPNGFGNPYTTFTFSVSDGAQFQVTPNTMTVCVLPQQDPPSATDNSITVAEESTATPLGLAAPTDIDLDPLTVTVTGLPSLGIVFLSDMVTVVSNGQTLTIAELTSLVYDAPIDFTIADAGSFTYEVSDGVSKDVGEVNITITAMNDPPSIDLNGATVGEDFKDTFTEGGAATAITDPAIGIADVDSAELQSLSITVGGVVDGSSEILSLAGIDFDLSVDGSQSVPIAGTNLDVTYIATTGVFTITGIGGGTAAVTAYEALLVSAAYRNNSPFPTTTDRTFNIGVVDDFGAASNLARSTICVAQVSTAVAWTLAGDTSVVDGANANYSLSLSASLRNGETASVDVSLVDVDTNSGDYLALDTAINTAVAAYSGPGMITWSGTTLTFTSDGTGAMSPLGFVVTTTPDAVYEGDEDFTIVLTNPSSMTGESVSIGVPSVTTTIADEDAPPTVSISNGSATEGTAIEFAISLNHASHENIALDLQAISGTATAVTDFEVSGFEYFDGAAWQAATTGTQVTLLAGTTSLLVRVDSVQDGNVEPNETFSLGASVLAGTVTNASDTGIGTIVNDDIALISIDDVTVDENNGTMTFTISLDQPSTGTVSVNWATSTGSSATTGVDFAASSGTATFVPGQQTHAIVININDDNLFEGSETFEVNLSGASGGTIVDTTGIGTIIDDGSGPKASDDDRPVISVSDAYATEDVDTHAVFTISISNPSAEDIVMSVATADVSATMGTDYGPGLEFFDGVNWQAVTGNITLVAGSTSIDVRTAVLDDAIIDDNETFSLVIAQVSGTTSNSGDMGIGTIWDDPTPDVTTVQISGPGSVTEGNLANYTVSINNVPLTDVTVTFTYSGVASGGIDYSGVASVTIPAGVVSSNFSIPTIDDMMGEPLESFTITIDTITGGSLEATEISATNNSVTTNIIDDDVPEISINDVIVTEGSEPHAEFTVDLSNPTFEDIAFDIVVTPVTASGNAVDFGHAIPISDIEVFDGTSWTPLTSATITSGLTSIRLRTPIIDDVIDESVDETFDVTVSTTSGATVNGTDTGRGTIQDDTTARETVLASIAGPPSVVEGDTTTPYTVSLTHAPVEDVTVTLEYSGTALDGSDFVGTATLTIATGSISEVFSLPTIDDSLYEITENIVVTIASVTGGGFESIGVDPAADTVTTLITDVADRPIVSVNDVTSVEGTDGFAVYTIELSNLSVEDIALSLALSAGTAADAGIDFGSSATDNLQVFDGTNWIDSNAAIIVAGEFSVQVRTPVVDDAIDEPTENYSLTVDVTSGTTANSQVIGVGTILDEDPAPDVTITDASTSEGDYLVFDVTLSNPSSTAITLDLLATDMSATSTSDYSNSAFEFSTDGGSTWLPAVSSTQVTIPALETTIKVRVASTEDNTLETTETMQLSVASVVSGLVGNTTDIAVGTITDDDASLVSIVANDAIASEPSDGGQFTVTMTNAADTATTIAYTVTGSASSGVDFTAMLGTITLSAGTTSSTIDLTVVDDVVIEGIEDVIITLAAINSGDADISIDTGMDSDAANIADDDVAIWQLAGQATVNEETAAVYYVDLIGTLQAGESVSVELSLTEITTIASDHDSLDAAMNGAVAAYAGSGTVAWNGTTLTYTSDGSGAMGQLPISISAVNDSIIEGPESFRIDLGVAASTTGAAVITDSANDSVTTTIQDTIDASGSDNDVATWSITGAASADEGSTPQYVVSLDGGLGLSETARVVIGLNDLTTVATDYADLVNAVAAAAAANPDVTFNTTTGVLEFFASTDGGMMADLVIDFGISDDAFIEGDEDFQLVLSAASSGSGAQVEIDPVLESITTTINDTQNVGGVADGPALWSITGQSSADEGTTAGYVVSLSGQFGAGGVVSVDLNLVDNSTNASDYAAFTAAVSAAASTNANVSLTGSTLTFTASIDGASMNDLVIDLGITNDSLIEGPEDYTLALSVAATSTGANVGVDPAAADVTTVINDTQGALGSPDGPAEWSITGSASADEGDVATYTVALTGQFGGGESASVNFTAVDLDTTTADYANLLSTVEAAAASRTDLDFDITTGTLTFNASNDGDTMTDFVFDLPIIDDTLIEGTEDFSMMLSSAASLSGAAVTIADDTVVTTINDTQGPGGILDGPATWEVSGPAFEDEGGTPQYLVTLSGAFGAGETASVEISHTDVTTSSGDYADFEAAVVAAAASHPNVSYNAGTLTFIAPIDGATMTPLVITLGLTDDAFTEGPEDFTVSLAAAGSTSGASVAVHATNQSVTTTIDDTQDLGGDPDGPAAWSIVGSTSEVEGATASYQINLSETFGVGEVAFVRLTSTDIDTNSSDYAVFANAMLAAIAGDPTLGFDVSTGVLTFTSPGDGAGMSEISVDVNLSDDVLIESAEDYAISLSDAGSSTGANVAIDAAATSATTTIQDNDGPAVWSIAGVTSVDEGATAQYTVSLSGQFGADEVVTVDLDLSDNSTNGSDYASASAAVAAAAGSNPHVVFNGSTLTFTAPRDGATMADLVIGLGITDDSLIEGPEDYTLTLSNATTSAGTSVAIDPSADDVTTVIDDTQGALGGPDGPATWSILGPAEVSEGTNASYTIGLAGAFQAGEVVSVQIALANNSTAASDHGDLMAQVAIAADMAADLAFDPTTGTLTYTAPTDGANMTPLVVDLPIADDSVVEFPENYNVVLSGEATSTGAAVLIDPSASDVTTTINGDPHLLDDIQHTSVGVAVTDNVLNNDFDPDSDPLTVSTTPVDAPANGTVTIAANGDYTYTPDPGFRGVDTFDYEVCDDMGNCEVATVTIMIADLAASKQQVNIVANGENFDVTFVVAVENTGSTRMDNLTLFDDVAAQFGSAFDSVSTPTLDASGVTGVAPTLNSAWASGTSTDLLDPANSNEFLLPGDSFTVTYTVTIDPDAAGNSTTLENQATIAGDDITTIPLSPLSVSDASDGGVDPSTNNTGAPGDSGGEDDATPVYIPDLAVAKQQVGAPVQLADRSWNVDFELIVENTGTVDLSAPSLLDDVQSQLGTTWHSTSNLAIDTAGIVLGGGAPGLNSQWLIDPSQDIFDGTGNLKPGESVRITFTVNMDPDDLATGFSQPMTNQAIGGGLATDAMGAPILNSAGDPIVVTDLSDSGSNPNTANLTSPGDSGATDDPTPISISEIGAAKRIVSSIPIASSAGHVALTYEIRIRNLGTNTLTGITLHDALSANLGPSFQNIVTMPSITSSTATLDPDLNDNFNGVGDTAIFDGVSGQLNPGEEIVVSYVLDMQLNLVTAASMNQVTVGAQDQNRSSVTDLSDTGSAPSGTNPNQTGDTGGEDDPTLPPAIGVAKNHGTPAQDGQDWIVPIQIVVQNLGLTDLTGINVVEDIASSFGAAFLSTSVPTIDTTGIVGGTAPNLNLGWVNNTEQNMLDGSGTLVTGDSFTISFEVTIDPDADGASEYLSNQVTVRATDPSNPDTDVVDTSDSGRDPTGSNLSEPGDSGLTEDPTPLQIPDVAVAKSVSSIQRFGSQFLMSIDLVLENTGTVDLANLTLSDDLAAQFGNHFTSIATAPTIIASDATTDPELNNGYITDTSENIFDGGSGLLEPGQSTTIRLIVAVNDAGISEVTLENQANGGGLPVDVAGSPVTDDAGTPLGTISDDSDSGSNPNGNNPGQPGDTGGFDDPTTTTLRFFTFDSFNDFSKGFGASDSREPSAGRLLTKLIPMLATDPLFSGTARPGTQIVGRVYDSSGHVVSESMAMADVGGNWMMQMNNPRHIETARVEFQEIPGANYQFEPNGDIYGYLGVDQKNTHYASLEPWTDYQGSYDFSAVLRGTASNGLARMHVFNNDALGLGL